MISIRRALFPLTLLCSAGTAIAQGALPEVWPADWRVIGVAEDETQVLVRPESIRELPPSDARAFSVRQLWAGFGIPARGAGQPARKVVLFHYDCAGRRVLIAAATDYARDGRILARNAIETDRADLYLPVDPETLNAAIMAQACPT